MCEACDTCVDTTLRFKFDWKGGKSLKNAVFPRKSQSSPISSRSGRYVRVYLWHLLWYGWNSHLCSDRLELLMLASAWIRHVDTGSQSDIVLRSVIIIVISSMMNNCPKSCKVCTSANYTSPYNCKNWRHLVHSKLRQWLHFCDPTTKVCYAIDKRKAVKHSPSETFDRGSKVAVVVVIVGSNFIVDGTTLLNQAATTYSYFDRFPFFGVMTPKIAVWFFGMFQWDYENAATSRLYATAIIHVRFISSIARPSSYLMSVSRTVVVQNLISQYLKWPLQHYLCNLLVRFVKHSILNIVV